MIELDPRFISGLRSSARDGNTPSKMLRELFAALPSSDRHPVQLVLYCSVAFCFAEGEAHPIFGWSLFEFGSLTDDQLDSLLQPRIGEAVGRWDVERALAS